MIYRITSSTIPVRSEASDRSEMCNELLYGEYVQELECEGSWMRVRSLNDSYEGWLALEYEPLESEQESTDVIVHPGVLEHAEFGPLLLSPGSQITKEEKKRFKPITNFDANTGVEHNLVEIAKSYLNTPYLWGGRSIWGIDCSGLIQIIYLMMGKKIPRDASQQVNLGSEIAFTESKTADLAFFENSKGKISHVGMLTDQEHIIHASGRVRIDTIDKHGIIRSTDGKRTHHLNCVKRLDMK